jgi:UDP-glucose 4-epimerase
MSKILITGGAGYIGSQTNLCLLENGFETLVFDNLVYGHHGVVPESSKCQFIQGDLLNLKDLEAVFENNKIEAVVHFAAFAYVGESVINPAKYYQNNVLGSFNLLETMRKYKCQKLVFSSTCATYGEPEILPITESEKQKPINPYGWSKLMIEQMIKDYHTAYGLSAVVFRYFNAAGGDKTGRTGENHNPETHLIPLVLKAAKGELDSIKVFGTDYDTPDGTCIRDYIHTEDLARAHFLGLLKLNSQSNLQVNSQNLESSTQNNQNNLSTEKNEQNTNQICEFINLASGNGYSVIEIIKMAEKITGKTIKTQIEKRRTGDPARLIADNSKAREFLGWNPVNSNLENIIQTAWNWENKL